MGSVDSSGYGKFYCNGKTYGAHRLAFLLANGEWPEVCCHKCHNRKCVRPYHLYNGTHESNVIDLMLNRLRRRA